MKKISSFYLPLAALIFLVTRLYNLKIIPIFTDEAIYTYWAQVALHDPANRFISLEDGKQPLFIWLAAIFQYFAKDPLIASRLVSVFAGFGSLIGLYVLTYSVFDKRIAQITCALYVIVPFTLLYDRMALFDSLLTMLGIWAIFFSVKLAKDIKLENSILAGVSIGLAMITKSSGNFFLYFLPLSLIFLEFKKNNRIVLLKWFPQAIVVFVISQIIYNSLRLSPLFYIIDRKNSEFIRTFGEILANPFLFFSSNVTAILRWITTYNGLPLFLIFLITLFLGFSRRDKRIIYFSMLALLPFFAESIFNKVLYPRFLLFYFPYCLIMTAYGLNFLIQKFTVTNLKLIIVVSFIFIYPMISSFWLLTDPKKANIADSDAGQYLNDWPAGFGVKEVTQFIKQQPPNQEIYVGTEGTFGLLPFALQIYFFAHNNIHIIGFWPVNPDKIPTNILNVANNNLTYFIFNENQKEINNPSLKFIAKYQKGTGNSYMRLYQVLAR